MPVVHPRTRAKAALLLDLLVCRIRGDLLVVEVSGEGMLPVVQPGDILLCSAGRRPWLGAIVVEEERLPDGETIRKVRRITALGGDTRSGVRIQPGFVWLETDNPESSADPRHYGAVPVERLHAIALALHRRGVLYDLRLRTQSRSPLRTRLLDAWRDWSRGITTGGFIRADAFGLSPSRFYAYQPTPWDVAREALKAIPISDDDVFIDYGCGKGRVLAAALALPFRRIVGIEVVPELVAIARRNVARWGTRCEVIEADASTIALPDDATVLYMANPFAREVLPDVAARIRESLARRARRLTVVTFGADPQVLAPLLSQRPRTLSNPLLHVYVLEPRSPVTEMEVGRR